MCHCKYVNSDKCYYHSSIRITSFEFAQNYNRTITVTFSIIIIDQNIPWRGTHISVPSFHHSSIFFPHLLFSFFSRSLSRSSLLLRCSHVAWHHRASQSALVIPLLHLTSAAATFLHASSTVSVSTSIVSMPLHSPLHRAPLTADFVASKPPCIGALLIPRLCRARSTLLLDLPDHVGCHHFTADAAICSTTVDATSCSSSTPSPLLAAVVWGWRWWWKTWRRLHGSYFRKFQWHTTDITNSNDIFLI